MPFLWIIGSVKAHGKDGDPPVKKFNTTGLCNPNRHYMVDISERLKAIKALVDAGDYFCINRGRQFGKTTTLNTLKDALQDDYTVFSISFESIGDETFEKDYFEDEKDLKNVMNDSTAECPECGCKDCLAKYSEYSTRLFNQLYINIYILIVF